MYFLRIFFFTIVLWSGPVLNLAAKIKDDTPLKLSELRRLVLINTDQPDSTPVIVSSNSCLCSCRDGAWACTDTSCKQQDEECEEVVPSSK